MLILCYVYQEMLEYGKILEGAGAVVEYVPTEGKDCILLSQLGRMLLFRNRDIVRPDDIICTVDVNTFVMSERVLNPVRLNPGKKVWLMQVNLIYSVFLWIRPVSLSILN